MLVRFADRALGLGRQELTFLLLRTDGVQSGPHDAGEVERRYRDGNLDRGVMSWREGEDRWISLGKRWTCHERSVFSACCIVIAMLAAGGAVAISRSQLSMLPFPLQTGTLLWLLVGALVGVTAATLFMAWRAASTARNRSLGLVVLTIAAAATAAMSLAVASVEYSVLRIRQKAPNATVTFDEADNAIRIQGSLGARLNAQFHDAMDRHPGARTIVLDSPGGLVEDALDLADEVRSRRLHARIEGMCASACVAVWAASPYREMSATSVVGVHRQRFDIRLPSEFLAKAGAESSVRYDDFLRSAGFDEATIRKGNQTPPSEVYWLNPVQLGAAGAKLVVVGDDGAPVTAVMTRWLWVEHALGERNSAARLMTAIREDAPSLVSRHAATIYDALIANSASALRQAMQSLSSDALVFALQRAPDKATVKWARGLYDLMHGDGRAASVCMLGAGGRGTPNAGVLTLADESNDYLSQLVSTIEPSEPVHRLATSSTSAAGLVLRRAQAEVRRAGFPTKVSRWTGVQWCQFRFAYFGYALQLPIAQAAEAVRYLELARSSKPT